MAERNSFDTKKLWIVVAAVGFCCVCLILFMVKNKLTENSAQGTLISKNMLPASPDPVRLLPVRPSDSVLASLLDAKFQLVNQSRLIPQDCMDTFSSSFVNVSGATRKKGDVDLADPDRPFQSTDVIVPGLSFRRLLFAGISSSGCFVYYQHGGVMYPSNCLVVVDYPSKRTVWTGETREKVATVEELRSLLSLNKFRDIEQSGC